MPRLIRSLPVALALGSGLATAGLLYAFLSGLQATPEALPTSPMVVAAGPLSPAETVAQEDLTVIEVAELPKGAFTDPAALVGRLPAVAVNTGEPVLASHLAPEGAQPALWYRIPPGMRAVTVAIDEVVGVGGFLQPGLTVDVVSVAREGQDYKARTVAQKLSVLAIAQNDEENAEKGKPKVAPSATLLVTPRQAEAISLATERGTIRLILRSPEDTAIVPPPKAPAPPAPPRVIVKTRTVQVPVAAPRREAPKPPSQPSIEVIHGSHSEVVQP